MALTPTRYAAGDGGRVAYRCSGDGERTILFTTWWGRSVDGLDDHPGAVRYFRYLEPMGRIAMLDPRGVGVSDPLPSGAVPDRTGWAADLRTVLDALELDRVVVMAEGFAAHAAIELATDDPARIERMHLSNAGARTSIAPHEVDRAVDHLARTWGTGEMGLAIGDHGTDRETAARAERLAASPAVAAAWLRAELNGDVRSLLPAVTTPALVTTIGDSGWHREADARALADGIAGASFLRLASHRLYAGDPDADAVALFLTGGEGGADERGLATVLFTDVIGSTAQAASAGDRQWRQILDGFDAMVAAQVGRVGGRLVKQTGDGHLAEFAGPSDAVRCARRIAQTAAELGVRVRVGVHTGEVERRAGGDLGGLTVHIASRIAGLAEQGEALVSRTVAELVAGSGFGFADRGEHELRGVPGRWVVLAVQAGDGHPGGEVRLT